MTAVQGAAVVPLSLPSSPSVGVGEEPDETNNNVEEDSRGENSEDIVGDNNDDSPEDGNESGNDGFFDRDIFFEQRSSVTITLIIWLYGSWNRIRFHSVQQHRRVSNWL